MDYGLEEHLNEDDTKFWKKHYQDVFPSPFLKKTIVYTCLAQVHSFSDDFLHCIYKTYKFNQVTRCYLMKEANFGITPSKSCLPLYASQYYRSYGTEFSKNGKENFATFYTEFKKKFSVLIKQCDKEPNAKEKENCQKVVTQQFYLAVCTWHPFQYDSIICTKKMQEFSNFGELLQKSRQKFWKDEYQNI